MDSKHKDIMIQISHLQYNFDFQNSGNTKTIFSLIEKIRELGCYVPIL